VWDRKDPTKKYAMKMSPPIDETMRERLRTEVRIMQHLGRHRGLVSLIDYEETANGSFKLVLDLCEGGELYDRIHKKGCYSEREAKIVLGHLLETISFMHSRGVMHRDLKPENILLTSRESDVDVKISDLGLAKISDSGSFPRAKSICGSDYYLAPEVIEQQEYGKEIDIWALGVVTYVLLSGSLPFFHNRHLHKLYRQIVERDISFPSSQWGNVSKGAQDFILRMLHVQPEMRMTAEQALQHPWLRGVPSPFATLPPKSVSDDTESRCAHAVTVARDGDNELKALSTSSSAVERSSGYEGSSVVEQAHTHPVIRNMQTPPTFDESHRSSHACPSDQGNNSGSLLSCILPVVSSLATETGRHIDALFVDTSHTHTCRLPV